MVVVIRRLVQAGLAQPPVVYRVKQWRVHECTRGSGNKKNAVMPRSLCALSFMEAVGGVAERIRLSKNPFISAVVEELVLGVAGNETHAIRKAPQLPVGVLNGFEKLVIDDESLTYARMYAWVRLVKIWGPLRFGDHRGLIPKLMQVTGAGLRGTLVGTKTSGAGPKCEELYVHIGLGAYIVESSCLEVGWRLWLDVSPSRDDFLMLPSVDLNDWVLDEARYTDCRSLIDVPGAEASWTE